MRKAGFILVFLSALGALSCGGAGGGEGAGIFYFDKAASPVSSVLVVPAKTEYVILTGDNIFKRVEDFSAYAVYIDGAVGLVSPLSLQVTVKRDGPEDHLMAGGESTYTFLSSGEKTITVAYEGRSASYAVQVRADANIPGDSGDSDGTGIDVGITW